MITTNEQAPIADLLGSAVEKLQQGDVDEAHRILVQLIRTHSDDADVIFYLAIARKRLGFDISAEALFSQAFDGGFMASGGTKLVAISGKPHNFRWTDESQEVSLQLCKRPRIGTLSFVKFLAPAETRDDTPRVESDDE